MILEIFFILLIISAFVAIQTANLRRAVIYLAVFSVTSALCYLLLGAPDVALAEAIIGCSLATIIYLVALTRYRVFTIYYINVDEDKRQYTLKKNALFKTVRDFCFRRELEPHFINTTHSMEEVIHMMEYDLIIVVNNDKVTFCGNKKNYHVDALRFYLEEHKSLKKNYKEVEICFN